MSYNASLEESLQRMAVSLQVCLLRLHIGSFLWRLALALRIVTCNDDDYALPNTFVLKNARVFTLPLPDPCSPRCYMASNASWRTTFRKIPRIGCQLLIPVRGYSAWLSTILSNSG